MATTNKLLAKRAKRDAKRKVLKQHNAANKVATNKARKFHMTRRDAYIKLRDDIYGFIVHKNNAVNYLKNLIRSITDLKETNDAKYDGLIVSAYETGLKKIDEMIEPRLTELAKIADAINPNDASDMHLEEYIKLTTKFNELTGIFGEIIATVNRYHNHNVSIYKNVEDPEHITEFSEDDFNFDFLDMHPEDMETTENADAGSDSAKEDENTNIHTDVEATVVVDDEVESATNNV